MRILTDNACPPPINLHQPDTRTLFSMYEQVPVDIRNSSDVRNSVELFQKSPLTAAFYSRENLVIIQNGIRAGVYNKSKNQYIIGIQDRNVIYDIMHTTFERNVRKIESNIPKQIENLNNIVIGYCVNEAFTNAKYYLKYLKTNGQLVMPMTYPVSATTHNSNRTHILPVGI